MSQFFASGGQSIGASASASVLPMNIQGWFPLGWSGWISLQSKGLSRVFSSTTVWKHRFFGVQPSLWSSSHTSTWPLEKTIALTTQTFVSKVISLLFNMLSRFVIACLHAQSCQTLCGPLNCSQPGSSVHGIFQARLLEWVAISYSRKFSWSRDQTHESPALVGRFFTIGATWEAL